MDEGKRSKRSRRSFTDEFKVGAVRLVLDEGKTVAQVARDLDLTESALRTWVERARADRTQGKTRPHPPQFSYVSRGSGSSPEPARTNNKSVCQSTPSLRLIWLQKSTRRNPFESMNA